MGHAQTHTNDTLSEDFRIQVSLWFYGDAPRVAWHLYILKLFDHIFGERIWSWKYFRRVDIYSLVVTVGLAALATLIIFHSVLVLDSIESPQAWWGRLILNAFIISVPFDYVSIAKTRLLLSWARKYTGSPGMLFLAVCADGIGTMLIVLIGFVPLLMVDSQVTHWLASKQLAYLDVNMRAAYNIVLPFVHIAWLLIYFVAAVVARELTWVGKKLPFFGRILSQERIEKSPITLIGEIAAGLILVIFLLIGTAMHTHRG